MTRTSPLLAILACLLLAPAAQAAGEQGDAGDLPAGAQDVSLEAVTQIDGSFAPGGTDVDLYKVCLTGNRSFSATTVNPETGVDTQLFLFDSTGHGVYGNDDSAGVRQSTLPAGHSLTPVAGGEHYLAVASFNRDPSSVSGPIFALRGNILPANEFGAADPVASWAGPALSGTGPYRVLLTGTQSCAPPDTTAPTVDLRSPAHNVAVARGAAVVVDFSCADEPGGSGVESCVGSVADGAALDTSALGPVSVTVTARDHAGNQTVVTHTVTVVASDQTAPLIDLRSPLDDAVYMLDERVPADYDCTDEPGGSGLASCVGSVPAGQAVDTSSVGEKQFAVEAADLAGNSAEASSSYSVVYDFTGFLWPVRNRPHVNRWKAGATVPIRFELDGNQGLDVIEDGWPQVAEVKCGSGAAPAAGVPARHPRWFRELVFRRHKQRYVFRWKTEREWAGSCRQFMLKLDDGTVKRADFEFVRRWWDPWHHDGHDHGHDHHHHD